MLYDIPGRTGVEIATETLLRLAEHPQIVANKDAKGDLFAAQRVMSRCELVYYSGAVHAFTQPMAGNDPSRGAAYQERADKRSWSAMRAFFDEIFAR
jgi:dihydrodipicolinate synthase/N-acetylneuraminate lyase